jgi:hypothetical protein
VGAFVISDKSTYKVAAGVSIKARDLIYISATGYAKPGEAPAVGLGTLFVAGSAIEDVDNTGGADGDKEITVEHSCGERAFLFAPAALTIADVMKPVYALTRNTLTVTATNAPLVGRLQGIEADGRARVLFTI